MEPTQLDEIANWLENSDYDTGVMLYERVIGPGFLLSMLKRGGDDYNRRQLTLALEAEHARLTAQAAEQQSRYPDALKADLDGAGILMDERTALKERLRGFFERGQLEGEENRQVAYRILAIRDALDRVFGRRKFFDEHGFLPGDTAPVATDPTADAERLKRRNTLRTYVTRYRKAASAATSEESREAATRLLQQYQDELQALEKHFADAVPD
jgi:hypothetical protein